MPSNVLKTPNLVLLGYWPCNTRCTSPHTILLLSGKMRRHESICVSCMCTCAPVHPNTIGIVLLFESRCFLLGKPPTNSCSRDPP